MTDNLLMLNHPSAHATSWLDISSHSTDATAPPMGLANLAQKLAEAFNLSPFSQFCGIHYTYDGEQMQAKIAANPNLIGNTAFNILHGGVAATVLDSIGGLAGMFEIYRRNQGSFEEQTKKVQRLATVDLRIDYLAPGRGKAFTATAEIIRLGRKGHTARMVMVNEAGKPIAHGIASYAF